MKGLLKATCACLLLAGCSSAGDDYREYFQVVRQGLSNGFKKGAVTLRQASEIPYASMGWRLDDGNQNIIVLATDNGQEQLWTSAAHIVLLTQHGRLTRTVGLPHNLSGVAAASTAGLVPPAQALKGPYTDQWIADFPDIGSFNIRVTCHAQVRGRQGIKILGHAIVTALVEERCNASDAKWSFSNTYWIDGTSGLVWRSVQHIHPDGDTLETEILRPAE